MSRLLSCVVFATFRFFIYILGRGRRSAEWRLDSLDRGFGIARWSYGLAIMELSIFQDVEVRLPDLGNMYLWGEDYVLFWFFFRIFILSCELRFVGGNNGSDANYYCSECRSTGIRLGKYHVRGEGYIPFWFFSRVSVLSCCLWAGITEVMRVIIVQNVEVRLPDLGKGIHLDIPTNVSLLPEQWYQLYVGSPTANGNSGQQSWLLVSYQHLFRLDQESEGKAYKVLAIRRR